jgi:type IV secretory pathway VirJ component
MKRALIVLLLLSGLAAAAIGWVRTARPQTLSFAEFGETALWRGGDEALVVVLADPRQRTRSTLIARVLSLRGYAVAIVDLDRYFAAVAAEAPDCFDATTLLDVYAQQAQQELHFGQFRKPLLIGVGNGAAYLKVLLSQAPAGVFAAGASLDAGAQVALPARPCGMDELWRGTAVPMPVDALRPAATPWADASAAGFWSSLLFDPGFLRAGGEGAQAAADLPLIELPRPADGGPVLAIVMSGDGGWANIDKDIGSALVEEGVAVIGWNSLRYFWSARTPEVMSADLARVIAHYGTTWHKPRVLLVGFSLGADVLPFMVSRLPPALRETLAGMVLLSPSRTVDFQFHISNWLHSADSSPHDPAAELVGIGGLRVLCIYGDEDGEGLCPLIESRPGTTVIALPGDHHFDGDYATVMRLIRENFLGPRPSLPAPQGP